MKATQSTLVMWTIQADICIVTSIVSGYNSTSYSAAWFQAADRYRQQFSGHLCSGETDDACN